MWHAQLYTMVANTHTHICSVYVGSSGTVTVQLLLLTACAIFGNGSLINKKYWTYFLSLNQLNSFTAHSCI